MNAGWRSATIDPMRVLPVYTNRNRFMAPPPIGLSTLCPPLLSRGHEVRLLDLMFVARPRAALDAPEEIASGDTAEVVVAYMNRGTATWTPTTTFLGTSVPRDRSSAFQSDTWIDDGVPCGVAAETAPGQEGTFRFSVAGPAPGDYVECFALFEEDVRWFGDEGQGGPPDDALCREIAEPASSSRTRPTG